MASFNKEENFVYFSVKNYGKRAALDVEIQMSDGFEYLQFKSVSGNYKHLLKQKFLAPGQEIKNLVSDISAIIQPRKKDAIKNFDFNIKFSDSDGKKYKINYQIDFENQYSERTILDETLIGVMKKILRQVEEQNKIIKQIISKS
ncbi:MAG: hypothetical protein HND52_19780 [Ignavibacteriae bacterium]|nr:hypothetical protein [Ignavibacteriota bacterium]